MKLSINQATILVAASEGKISVNDCMAIPLVNLIRKRLVTIAEPIGTGDLYLSVSAKGISALPMAKSIIQAREYYHDLCRGIYEN